MKYKQLGRTGLFVSEICLGTMTFGGSEQAGMWRAIGTLQQGEVDAIVGSVAELGRLTDTPTPTIDAIYASVKLLEKTLRAAS